jgi:16S rRNA (cytosine1402-N4)-methyltransferase
LAASDFGTRRCFLRFSAPVPKSEAVKRTDMSHTPVLQKEVAEYLAVDEHDIVVDMTVGNGGHAHVLCSYITDGHLIGIDQDEDATRTAREVLADTCECNISVVNDNFRNIDSICAALDVDEFDKALFDLGMRSQQIEESGRGFSFQKNEPLLMTFEKHPEEEDLTAWEIVNKWQKEHIVDILDGYADERYADQIAEKIVDYREGAGNIGTSDQLAAIIKKAVPSGYDNGRIHPATRTFQALRITVNDEIRALQEGLDKTFDLLASGGRIGVISFHSIEDRTVKKFFQNKVENKHADIINDAPVTPTQEERDANPRSRSAKLRIVRKS